MSTDPYERRDQTFPRLTPEQVDAIRPHGEVRRCRAGEELFRAGEQHTDFVVVLSGRIEIVQARGDGTEERITVHGPREFTGEIDMFSSRRSLVTGRVLEAGEMLVVPRAAFQDLLAGHADLGEVIMRAFILRRLGLLVHGQGDVLLVGSRFSSDTLRLRSFLSRNGHPHRYLDLEQDEEAGEMLRRLRLPREAVPVVLCRDRLMRNPDNRTVADCVGLSGELPGDDVVDLAVIGAGPAGLAAAVYGASEGLSVVVFEAEAPGGQAGTSSRIENYLGFPTGISGQDLAGRAINQAQKFGARLLTPRRARALHCEQQPYRVELEDGDAVRARTIVVASGARYRRLDLPELPRFEGRGVYYGATSVEALLCGQDEVTVVGGGNSAGQAAVFLADLARHVHLLVRGEGLADTMSNYLLARIETSDRITLHPRTEIVGLEGEACLERQVWRDGSGGRATKDIRHLFVMIGADPNTEWVRGCLALDRKGFLLAGDDAVQAGAWPLARPPFFLETSRPRVFAAGDVRSGSVKRVASAVGEGSMCVAFIHRVLHEAHAVPHPVSPGSRPSATASAGSDLAEGPPKSIGAGLAAGAGPPAPGEHPMHLKTDDGPACEHLDHLPGVRAPRQRACEECVPLGARWVHLRTCQDCGVTLCCDSSPNRHATKHHHASGHPVIASAEPGEHWLWCYVDEQTAEYRP